MTEHPALLTGEMVRAVLEGRKTQHRVPVTKQLRVTVVKTIRSDVPFSNLIAYPGTYDAQLNPQGAVAVDIGGGRYLGAKPHEFDWMSPFGKPGDVLWMRCPYVVTYDPERNEANWCGPSQCRMWVSTHGTPLRKDGQPMKLGRKPAMHMPRWLSAEAWPALTVKRVWAERVQEISEADSKAEGVGTRSYSWPENTPVSEARDVGGLYRNGFRSLWDSIYAAKGHGWDANGFVWCCEFEPLLTPDGS